MQQLIRIAQHQPIRIARRISIKLAPSGGYPLTVIPVEERNRYMSALERASVEQDIRPFAEFLAWLVQAGLEGKPVARLNK